jgi:hypothetical protein
MHDQKDVPKVSPPTVFALFTDIPAARVALEALLQGGFHGEQLGWMKGQDTVPTPANDTATYRATGLENPPSADLDHPPDIREMFREDAIVLSVAPREGQDAQARELLTALGGRLVREDGSLEEAA